MMEKETLEQKTLMELRTMAKEMGLNPKSLIKNIPSPREQWKQPVKIWIREMYEERHRKKRNRTASS